MKNNRLKLLSAVLFMLILIGQPAAAFAGNATETADLLLQTLLKASFKADMSAGIAGEDSETMEGRLYRQPPDRFRLEYYKDGELVGYYLEDATRSVRVFPRDRRAIIVRGRRLSPIFNLIAGCLDRVPRTEGLVLAEGYREGRGIYVLQTQSGLMPFSAVFDAEDKLLREFSASRRMGGPDFKMVLSNVEIVATSTLPPGFFAVPPEFKLVGLGMPLGEGQRERLKGLQRRLPGALHRSPEAEGIAEETTGDGYFLPALPKQLPRGFLIESVTPLFFSERLLYHIELVNSEDVQLVSVFETKHEEYRDEFRGIQRGDEKYYLDLPFGDTGIYVILISEDVKEEQLREIFKSLEFQPELALQLIDEALTGILTTE